MERQQPFQENVPGRLDMFDNFRSRMGGKVTNRTVHGFAMRKSGDLTHQSFLIQRIRMVEIE